MWVNIMKKREGERETWWWSEGMQKKLKEKSVAYKEMARDKGGEG